MSAPDITVAITAHDETFVAAPTIRSAELAVAAARDAGFSVECLIGFDTPTDACLDFFAETRSAGWQHAIFAFKDQGQTRNALAEIATGRWIAFLDADDLFSENWLVRAAGQLAEAQSAGERIIVHPELCWFFEGSQNVMVNTPQDSPLFDPAFFYFANYYDALCMAPRAAHLQFPYSRRDIAGGYAYEDWQWNIETMARDWRHVVAKDTIIFKRRRKSSQTLRAHERMAVIRNFEPLAIDKIADLARTGART